MHIQPWLPILAAIAACGTAIAQSGRNEPRAGYLYPAGACRGSKIEIIAGGQNLRSMKSVRVSGEGVTARIIKTYRIPRNLDADQRKLLAWRIACRRATLNGKPLPKKPREPKPPADAKPAPAVELPDSPLLDLLDTLDLKQLTHWETYFQRHNRAQPTPQIGELARVEIEVAGNAKPGMRELRFLGPPGLTQPLRFEVGTLREIRELEPNEATTARDAAPPDTAKLPCTFNGQIQAGDVDLFHFHARRGQNLIVQGQARSLIPYLADAVPGWFQMVLAVRDSSGRELAYGDSFRFDPDPVLFCKIPEDGDYVLEVRDSIHRGREDFIYRIHIGELPYITANFPLGGRQGEPLVTSVRGWNLPGGRMKLDTAAGTHPLRKARMFTKTAPSNELKYAVDTLDEAREVEPNDGADAANSVTFPCVINGIINKARDHDVFRIDGRKGTELFVEVLARRLGSPLDAVVHIADESGRVIGWNDDAMEKDGHLHLGDGTLTHHADPSLRVQLPTDGPFFVRIADTQLHGGPEYGYRIRLVEAQPDFELKVTPSALNVMPGGHVPFEVHVLRRGGFDGEIDLSLTGAPAGFTLSGARIPAGAKQARLTIGIPLKAKAETISPQLVGSARQGGIKVTRPATAADNMMQAFLWRHLVDAESWQVCVVNGRGKRPVLAVKCPQPLHVPIGGAAMVKVEAQKWLVERGLTLETDNPPPGIHLSAARPVAGGFAFDVMAEPSEAQAGLETQLIVHLFSDGGATKAPARKNARRFPIAGLPAIPITLVTPPTP